MGKGEGEVRAGRVSEVGEVRGIGEGRGHDG